ncbi:hypothetical protein [Streptomyces beijiangensis]|uniref:Secreted protein n=1 Tax=Streptomyces beijiangensis TaxID=163361 RepID=A0A939FBS5_9ACTN|nr:hypothetical protein [Streptomyces beijiangensis]MBO0515369.1 hypothetical protein [Streptomyces beijiangensis]
MRLLRRRSVALLTAGLALAALTAAPSGERAAAAVRQAPAAVTAPEPFGADCRTTVEGSHVVAYCHNPYPDSDRVELHVECARWWDIDADGRPVEVGPAQTVRLTDRCWKEIRAVWITHARS